MFGNPRQGVLVQLWLLFPSMNNPWPIVLLDSIPGYQHRFLMCYRLSENKTCSPSISLNNVCSVTVTFFTTIAFLFYEALPTVYNPYARSSHTWNHIKDASCQITILPLVTPAQIYWGRLPLSNWWISGVPSQTLKRQTRDIHIRARITPRSSVSELFWPLFSEQPTEDKMWLLPDMINGRDH